MSKRVKLLKGDNIASLKSLPDNSIDSIVSDPPYGLSFMNKKWDYDVPSVEFWKEAFRVLKPGGHVLSFGGTRTYHRMVVNMEDAGFEIRDQIMWIYGSGFPKSLNIGKAVDKKEGNERQTIMRNPYADGSIRKATGNTGKDDNVEFLGSYELENGLRKDTKGDSPYEGWGTALKPANEPICLARKPLSEKSVAENVIKWKTGGLNIDGCRIGTEDKLGRPVFKSNDTNIYGGGKGMPPIETLGNEEGRFPANIILDETAAELLDEQTGYLKSGEVKPHHKKNKTANGYQGSCYGKFQNADTTLRGYGDGGGASRFFYVAKVSKKERNMGLDGFDIQILTPTIKLLLKTDYNNKNFIWEKEDLKTKPVDTDKSHQKDTDEYITTEDNKWNTELYGSFTTEQFLTDAKSIIETETNSTTIYQTLNLLIQKNIKKNTQELLGEMVSDIKFVENADKTNTKVYITYQKKDGLSPNVNHVSLEGQWNISVKENKCGHPTLKPINLMTYLCRLITPPNGIVLDPFMGSGSTGIAAQLEGFRFCGMELDEDYFKIAEARIENFEKYRDLLK